MSQRQQIRDVFEMLGNPQYREILLSVDEPFMQRATWSCGCVIDFVDEQLGAFAWDICAAHHLPRIVLTPQGAFISGSDQ